MTLVTRRVSLIALWLLVATPCLAQSTGGFRPTGDMTTPRSFHTATRRAPISRVAMFARGGGQSQIADVSELAFVRDDQIFKVRSDGTGLVQLTSDGMNSEPAWSPDGSRIAFVHSDGNSGGSQIYVMNADGSNVVQRTIAGGSSPAWSPDGTRIAFAGDRIYVMRVDQDWWNPAPLGFDRGWNGQPAWSPDGTRIAFVSDWRAYDLLYDLYVMNADGSDLKLLLGGPFFSPWLTYYFQPAWSPDGGTIALNVCPYAWDNCFPDSTVALVNADGSGLRSIASAGGYAHPSWSPDGTIIAFGSSACRECPSNIQYVTRNGSGSGVLVWDAHSPTWRPSTGGQLASPDGTTVPTATQIIDNSGAIWTLGSNAAVLRNGAQVGGAWASTIYWKTSTIYVYGLDLNWWQWTGSTWVNLGPAMPGGATGGTGSGTTSPDGTMIPTTASQIVDAAGAVWSLGSNTAVLRNGAQVGGAWASRIFWKTSTIYVYGLDLNWWQWTGTTWVNLGTTLLG